MNPIFLDLGDVIAIHELQLERFGGGAGLRDAGLLDSAVAQAQAAVGGEYLHDNLFMMAAAYLFHIVRNHPFVDGNKRAGLMSALVFLELNDHAMTTESDELFDITMSVAIGSASKEHVASILRRLHAAEMSLANQPESV